MSVSGPAMERVTPAMNSDSSSPGKGRITGLDNCDSCSRWSPQYCNNVTSHGNEVYSGVTNETQLRRVKPFRYN